MITHTDKNVKTDFYVSRLPAHNIHHYTTYPIDVIFKEIASGAATIPNTHELIKDKTLRGITEYARQVLALNNPVSEEAYQLIKIDMPAFTVAGILSSNGYIETFSGLAVLDFDAVEDPDSAIALAAENPHTLSAFRTLRGKRIKVIYRIVPNASDTGMPLNAETYKDAWMSGVLAYEEIGLPDPAGNRPTALTALVYDPDVYINLDAIPLPWSVDEETFKAYFPESDTQTQTSALRELPLEYQDAIREMEWNEKEWGKTKLPCIFKEHEHDGWELRTNAMGVRRNAENDYTLSCRKCDQSRRYTDRQQEIPSIQEMLAMEDEATRCSIENAPPIEAREMPSFPYFSPEERIVLTEILNLDPDAGWIGPLPYFITKYESISSLIDNFPVNGQPPEINKYRIWHTLPSPCEVCGYDSLLWINRYSLTGGRHCPSCQKDYPLGSYLAYELDRKLPNSIVSDYQGFLGDNPDFQDFRLWEPGVFTHLGAAMSTGKTTTIAQAFRDFAKKGLGRCLLIVPRVSLVRFLLLQLRMQDGPRAWGGWYEGSDPSDLFIGDIGAVVCMPSLPRVVEYAQHHGNPRLYIAIDEVDFSYNILTLNLESATKTKQILRNALQTTGLVTAGQTESTLSLEALIAELEASEVQGFYASPLPSDGIVTLHKYPDETGKENALVDSAIAKISTLLSAGRNAYVFCTKRRDAEIIADVFAHENPVVYNSYTKGSERADAVLFNQRLTDSCLFIATNAVDVGISIHDPNGETVRVGGMLYGSRQPQSDVQSILRLRDRNNASHLYADYKFPLPLKPVETQDVSIYHEYVKQSLDECASIPTGVVEKIARAEALMTLADAQFETFALHHLEKVANMQIALASVLPSEPDALEAIAERRKSLQDAEHNQKREDALAILKEHQQLLLTNTQRRKRTTNGRLTPQESLAQEYANRAAQAVGWNDKRQTLADLDTDDIQVASDLVTKKVDLLKLQKQLRGYIARHFPKWTETQVRETLTQTYPEKVRRGSGIEITAVVDDRLLGKILDALIKRIQGQLFDPAGLADAVRQVMKQRRSRKTFLGEIQHGALGTAEYRKARMLGSDDDQRVVDWVGKFIDRWYPARISTEKETYRLVDVRNIQLRLDAFKSWLKHQNGIDPPKVMPPPMETPPAPGPSEVLIQQALELRNQGISDAEIARRLKRSKSSISRWFRAKVTSLQKDPIKGDYILDIPATHVTLREQIHQILSTGEKQTAEILAAVDKQNTSIKNELKRLVVADEILKIHHGVYALPQPELVYYQTHDSVSKSVPVLSPEVLQALEDQIIREDSVVVAEPKPFVSSARWDAPAPQSLLQASLDIRYIPDWMVAGLHPLEAYLIQKSPKGFYERDILAAALREFNETYTQQIIQAVLSRLVAWGAIVINQNKKLSVAEQWYQARNITEKEATMDAEVIVVLNHLQGFQRHHFALLRIKRYLDTLADSLARAVFFRARVKPERLKPEINALYPNQTPATIELIFNGAQRNAMIHWHAHIRKAARYLDKGNEMRKYLTPIPKAELLSMQSIGEVDDLYLQRVSRLRQPM